MVRKSYLILVLFYIGKVNSSFSLDLSFLPLFFKITFENGALAERSELVHLETQIIRMLHRRVDELPAEETTELLLIIGAESGLSIFSKAFQPDHQLEEHLFAGFLTAIDAFGRDTLANSGIEGSNMRNIPFSCSPWSPSLSVMCFKAPPILPSRN